MRAFLEKDTEAAPQRAPPCAEGRSATRDDLERRNRVKRMAKPEWWVGVVTAAMKHTDQPVDTEIEEDEWRVISRSGSMCTLTDNPPRSWQPKL